MGQNKCQPISGTEGSSIEHLRFISISATIVHARASKPMPGVFELEAQKTSAILKRFTYFGVKVSALAAIWSQGFGLLGRAICKSVEILGIPLPLSQEPIQEVIPPAAPQ